MTTIHIFRESTQSATRYKIHGLDMWMKNTKRTLIICHDCLKKRWAKNLYVRSYYDGDYFHCKDKQKCKKK